MPGLPATDIEEEHSEVEEVALAQLQWLKVCCGCQPSMHSVTTVSVSGNIYCALWDTGAQVSLVREDVFQDLQKVNQCQLQDCGSVQLSGVGEGSHFIVGVTEFNVSVANQEIACGFPFAVVSREALPVCFLLGINFIDKYKVVIDYTTASFRVARDNEVYWFPLGSKSHAPLTVQYCFGHLVSEVSLRELDNTGVPLLLQEAISAMQHRDFAINLLHNLVLEGVDVAKWKRHCIERFRKFAAQLSVTDGVLYCSMSRGKIPVVPFQFLVEVAITVHVNMAHIGRHKLMDLVGKHVWHPGMEGVVRDICGSCIHCQKYKISHQMIVAPTLKIVSSFPFELVSVDLVDFPKSSRLFCSVLMVVDHCSKWLVSVPLRDKTGKTVSEAFEHRVIPVLPRVPDRVLSDNGPEFRSVLFNGALNRYNIAHVYSTPYKPSSNGGVERVNRTIAEVLRGLTEDIRTWDLQLSHATIVYNNTIHRAVNMTPAEFLLRKEHDLVSKPLVTKETGHYWTEGHPDFQSFKVGQLVLYRVQCKGNCTEYKLRERYEGPYRIATAHGNGVTYVIERKEEEQTLTKSVHHRQIKLFIKPPQYLVKHRCFPLLEGGQGEGPPDESDSDTGIPMLVVSDATISESEEAPKSEVVEDPLPKENGRHEEVTATKLIGSKRELRQRSVRRVQGVKRLEDLPCSEPVPDELISSTPVKSQKTILAKEGNSQDQNNELLEYVSLEVSGVLQELEGLAGSCLVLCQEASASLPDDAIGEAGLGDQKSQGKMGAVREHEKISEPKDKSKEVMVTEKQPEREVVEEERSFQEFQTVDHEFSGFKTADPVVDAKEDITEIFRSLAGDAPEEEVALGRFEALREIIKESRAKVDSFRRMAVLRRQSVSREVSIGSAGTSREFGENIECCSSPIVTFQRHGMRTQSQGLVGDN